MREKISTFKDIAIKIIQHETQGKKTDNKRTVNPLLLSHRPTESNITHGIGLPEEEERTGRNICKTNGQSFSKSD